MVTLEALNNFANESSGEASFVVRRGGDTDLEATVVLETTNVQPPPNPARGTNQSYAVAVISSPSCLSVSAWER